MKKKRIVTAQPLECVDVSSYTADFILCKALDIGENIL